jgi:hypothetical protein
VPLAYREQTATLHASEFAVLNAIRNVCRHDDVLCPTTWTFEGDWLWFIGQTTREHLCIDLSSYATPAKPPQ